ncbi:hypothetical protein PP175_15070 [Aneurinibacillus sp. Ricciae_BoGa-3]|uniref:hypothetical protein n=1 Tax=Aneurinibacillus sp. Ricciae_BoGa-3 TaxID=3022697 RepID=UPI0023406ADC|nr:hypothetical protein [Aneurinibacillus sp. Ricciae_BoGa-3]WCK52749.1 hypothetical protein PP175_15070 [Aneurinibacillus sp. Ricciae_BoGa-3]
MSSGMLESVFLFMCGCSVGIVGIGGICYLALHLACRRDELLKLNEMEEITPSFTYDPHTQMLRFDADDYLF